jgi:hypothetical protein
MVSTVLIEECVLQRLQFLFSTDSVLDMDDSLITSVAAESPGSAIQRKRLTEKMKTLGKGLVAMRNFEKLNLNPKSVCQDPIGSKAQITNGGPFQQTAQSSETVGNLAPLGYPIQLRRKVHDRTTTQV